MAHNISSKSFYQFPSMEHERQNCTWQSIILSTVKSFQRTKKKQKERLKGNTFQHTFFFGPHSFYPTFYARMYSAKMFHNFIICAGKLLVIFCFPSFISPDKLSPHHRQGEQQAKIHLRPNYVKTEYKRRGHHFGNTAASSVAWRK